MATRVSASSIGISAEPKRVMPEKSPSAFFTAWPITIAVSSVV